MAPHAEVEADRQGAQTRPPARLEDRGRRMNVPQGWSLDDDGKALVRSFRFKDFSEAFAFLTRVALHAEKVDHHPEFTSVVEPRRLPPDEP